MPKKSIFYQFPRLYLLGLRWLHKKNFNRRYQYIASFTKKGDLVLEPGCGPAILADYLPKDVVYKGFDTNQNFLDYALKKKKHVYFGNALDFKKYCKADVVAICDLLHHLAPLDRKKFIKICLQVAKKKLILCEPANKKLSPKDRFYRLRRKLAEWSEQDGTGNLKIEHFFTKETLEKAIKTGFGVIPSSVPRINKKIGDDIIVVFNIK